MISKLIEIINHILSKLPFDISIETVEQTWSFTKVYTFANDILDMAFEFLNILFWDLQLTIFDITIGISVYDTLIVASGFIIFIGFLVWVKNNLINIIK